MVIAPTNLSYGPVPLGVTETHTFTLINAGQTTLTIEASTPPSAGVGFGGVSTLSAGTTIAPGASLTETVAFAPTTLGAAADTWSFTTSDGLGQHIVNLTGTGAAPLTPTLSVNWLQHRPTGDGNHNGHLHPQPFRPEPEPGIGDRPHARWNLHSVERRLRPHHQPAGLVCSAARQRRLCR